MPMNAPCLDDIDGRHDDCCEGASCACKNEVFVVAWFALAGGGEEALCLGVEEKRKGVPRNVTRDGGNISRIEAHGSTLLEDGWDCSDQIRIDIRLDPLL